jgi:DNA-binding HxlR family transcriptional regulator
MPGPRRSYVCGIDAAVDVVQGKWKVLILWALGQGHRRFGALRRELPGVSEKVLASQLRELESDGIVHRQTYDEVPPRVEYSLTGFGASLNEALAPLGAWGREHKARLEARPAGDLTEAAAAPRPHPAGAARGCAAHPAGSAGR